MKVKPKQRREGKSSDKKDKLVHQSVRRKIEKIKQHKIKQNRQMKLACSTSYFEVTCLEESSNVHKSDMDKTTSQEGTSDEHQPSTSSSLSDHGSKTAEISELQSYGNSDSDADNIKKTIETIPEPQDYGNSFSDAESLNKTIESITLSSDDDTSSVKSIECDASFSQEFSSPAHLGDDSDSCVHQQFSPADVSAETDGASEDNQMQTESSSKALITFRQVTNKEFLVIFKPSTKLYFHGKMTVELVEGTVTILGWRMSPLESRLVFSPKGSSLFSIEAGPQKCIVKLRAHDCHLTSCLERHVPLPLFKGGRSGVQFPTSSDKLQAERGLDCRFVIDNQFCDAKKLTYGPEWASMLNYLTGASNNTCNLRIVLCGGKGVGKSTLLRVVVNTLMQNGQSDDGVMVIDLDPGQAEFTAPGILSATRITSPLLGPGFTQQRTPTRQVYLGNIDSSRCAEEYRQAVKDLVKYCDENHSSVPWVINTMGFTTGLGVAFMDYILHVLESRINVIEIQSRNYAHNYPPDLWSQAEHIYHYPIFSGAETAPTTRRNIGIHRGPSARLLREIALLSYLSPALNESEYSLMTSVPYVIRLEKLTVGIVHERVHPNHVLRSLLGNLVGLCSLRQATSQDCVKPYGKPGPLVIARRLFFAVPCIGYGVVTGVDIPAGQLFLQTPEPYEKLSKVNCLLLGAVQLPDQLRTAGVKQGPVPFTVSGDGQPTGAPVRRFYRPVSRWTPSK